MKKTILLLAAALIASFASSCSNSGSGMDGGNMSGMSAADHARMKKN